MTDEETPKKEYIRALESEMKRAFIDYSMSVIMSRALPDVRDGLKPVHRRILYAMNEMGLTREKPYKKSARVVGECFVKDTLVLTDHGLTTIQDIKRGDKVYTQGSLERVNELYMMPKRELLKITLENGIENIVTKSQKFKVLTKDWRFEWKEAQNLTENDFVVLKSDYPEIKHLVKLKTTKASQPQYLNENIAYLLGLFISDGWISEDYSKKKLPRIGFCGGLNREIAEKVSSIFRQDFNYNPTIEVKSYQRISKKGKNSNKQYSVRINRKTINEFFVSNFSLKGVNAFTKKIPQQIFNSPTHVIFAFISGLIEGDGSIHKNRNMIHYGSISQKIINQLMILLQHQGIFSSKHVSKNLKERYVNGRKITDRHPFFYLEIHGSDAVELSANLNLVSPRKKMLAQKLAADKVTKRKAWSQYDVIPYAGENIFGELSDQHLGGGWYNDANGEKFRSGIKYPEGCKIRYSKDLKTKSLHTTQIKQWGIKEKLDRIESSLNKFIEHVLQEKISFLKVSSVEKTEAQETFDIEVENDHEFIANGMVSHNCLGKYHPHGDQAVYDSMVRMAQDFSLRYPLVDGQGNFGCFTKDTKVKLTDGRKLDFEELIKESKNGKKHWTFTFNPDTKKIEITEIKNPRLTKKNEEIIEIILDNQEKIKCTLDHRFMLRDRRYKQAKDLKTDDSLMPIYIKTHKEKDLNLKDYTMVYQPIHDKWEFIHRLSDEWNLKNGIYKKKAGKVRHHLDFNKLNNNPDNILRVKWKEHWNYHKKIASWRHKNDVEYVQKIAKGRIKYWAKPENRKKASNFWIEYNKRNWKNPDYRKKMSKAIKNAWQNPEYRKKISESSSKNLKRLWKEEGFRKLMSSIKSKELKERWQQKKYREIMSKHMQEISLKIWSYPEHRRHISRLMKEKWRDPEYRQKQTELSKMLWKKSEYRAKFSPDHFSNMAKKLWADPKTRKLHRKKAIKQWQSQDFRDKVISGIKKANRHRLEENPNFMNEIAQKAKKSLKKKWNNPAYKREVIKSRILSYVNFLINKYPSVTPEIYEKERKNKNHIPRIENSLNYFDNDFRKILIEAETHNHKVISTKILGKEDVYDLTVEPWHNFALASGVFVHNSVDGDAAASMRYTEARLTKIAKFMLQDIEKETVDWTDNFDGSLKEPVMLPAVIPNLLINGASGIAVGMATNMAPHNITEVIDGTIQVIDNPEINTAELMEIIQGPDFPTGGIIYGRGGILQAYSEGRGLVRVRAKTHFEGDEKKKIIITELPYQVNKANLLKTIAELVKDKKIEGIGDLRDESDREGMRVVIDLKRDAIEEVVLSQLFKHTDMQTTFGVNNLAIVEGEPKTLTLKEMIQHFIEYRILVITRRTNYDLKKAQEKMHILEGFMKALKNIDEVIKIIRGSKTVDEAKQKLMQRFEFSELQVKAILDLRLQKLTGMEIEGVEKDYNETKKLIEQLEWLLSDKQHILDEIKKELIEIKEKFGDERRTEIVEGEIDIDMEDLIPVQDVVITITDSGYIKRIPCETYRTQRRGGKGLVGMKTKEEDVIVDSFITSTHDYIMFFTNQGKCFWLKGYKIPEGSRHHKGKAIINLLPRLEEGEYVETAIPIHEFDDEHYLVFVTKKGIIKKTVLSAYSNIRVNGVRAIKLDENDELIGTRLSDGSQTIMIATANGQACRFDEKEARAMGRVTRGVIGVRLRDGDKVVSMAVVGEEGNLLTITENGYGKRSPIQEYRKTHRGSKGVRTIITNERNGKVLWVREVEEDDEIMLTSREGMMVRIPVNGIRVQGRNTMGVTIMKLNKDDKVVSVAKIMEKDEEEECSEEEESKD